MILHICLLNDSKNKKKNLFDSCHFLKKINYLACVKKK